MDINYLWNSPINKMTCPASQTADNSPPIKAKPKASLANLTDYLLLNSSKRINTKTLLSPKTKCLEVLKIFGFSKTATQKIAPLKKYPNIINQINKCSL